MKQAKAQNNQAKLKKKGDSDKHRTVGRPARTESVQRLAVYLPESVAIKMREKLSANHDAVSSYIIRLIERDLFQKEIK